MTEKKQGGYLKGVRSEMKKVIWPDRKDTIQYTVTTLVFAILVALFCWGLDLAFGGIIGLFVRG